MCLPVYNYSQSLINGLKQFNTVTLAEMEQVRLMDRLEQKFVFNLHQLVKLLPELSEKFSILEINNKLIHSYYSVYFDTPCFDMYQKHHNGKANRHKIRQRFYNSTNSSFLEVKLKNNKGRVKKNRIETQTELSKIPEEYEEFIFRSSGYNTASLQKKLENSFNRITLTDNKLRFTIDLNLTYSSDKKQFGYNNLVIGELKSLCGNANKTISRELKKQHIYPAGISKYCLGLALLNPQLKTNMFKQKINIVNKLNYA